MEPGTTRDGELEMGCRGDAPAFTSFHLPILMFSRTDVDLCPFLISVILTNCETGRP